MTAGCPFDLCDGTGWREAGGNTVSECLCRPGGEPPCPVPACVERCAPSIPLCRPHWHGLPRSLRERLARAQRAYEGGKATREDFEEMRAAAIDAARQEAMPI